MAGTLYLCATPIGNLEDITFRVLRVLREADLIAAEDTRNSIRLLNYFEIETPMTSYHEYNKFDKGRVLIEKLLEGKDIRECAIYANCTAAVSVQYVGATGGVTDKAIVDKMLAKYREDYK